MLQEWRGSWGVWRRFIGLLRLKPDDAEVRQGSSERKDYPNPCLRPPGDCDEGQTFSHSAPVLPVMSTLLYTCQCPLLAISGFTNHTLNPSAFIRKGEADMTKAKARLRAKAKAAQKTRKREAEANRPAPKIRLGQFDPGPGSIKGPIKNTHVKNFAGAKRGAARSR